MAKRETDETRAESDEQRGDGSPGDAQQEDEAQGGGAAEAGQKDDGRDSGGGEKEERAKQQKQQREERKKKEKEEADEGGGFSLKRLHWAELVGFAGSGVLAGSLFLPWFATSCTSNAEARVARRMGDDADCVHTSVYNGMRGEFTAFETFKYLDWLLVAACVAPFILAYIIARAHTLSWRPGEVTMIVGMTAFALILLNGIVLGKPGDTVEMEFRIGYLVGLGGATLIMMGGILRQALAGRERKPPGVM